MFGNPITDGVQLINGPYGDVVAFDLTVQNLKELNGVDLVDLVTNDSLQLASPSTKAEVFSMPFSSTNLTDAAYYREGPMVYVFVRIATYEYDANTRIAFWYSANPDRVTTLTGTVMPLPAQYKQLALAMIARNLIPDDPGLRPGFVLDEAVRSEKAKVGL